MPNGSTPGKASKDFYKTQVSAILRLIATGVVKKEWAPVKRKPKEILKNVTVLLGDPEKPDPIKPQARFDEDDLYTIDRLKAALREKKDHNFSYLINHDQFIAELSKLKGTIAQKTPTRVLRRRADIVRKRKVLEITWKKTGEKRIEIEVTTEAGLYIKELVSGDSGRTEPSVSGLLKTDASVKELTVVGVGE